MLLTSAHTIEGAGVSSLELTPEDSAVVRHLAHELRQPLSTIESTAYYLGIILPPGEVRARKQVDKLQWLVQQTNDIIADALSLMAPVSPRLTTIDLAELVSSCAIELASGPVELCVLPEVPECLVRMDLGMTRRIVSTLLNFVRNYGADEPQLALTLSATGSVVRFHISFEATSHVWENVDSMFDPMTPYLPGGGGLALASAKRMAEAQHAALWAEIESVTRVALILEIPRP